MPEEHVEPIEGWSADHIFVPESASRDVDVVVGDTTIRHRLVYTQQRPDAQDLDYRVHALKEANVAYANSSMRFEKLIKTEEGLEVDDTPAEAQHVADQVLAVATRFETFLRGQD